jgi:hypothetical protein
VPLKLRGSIVCVCCSWLYSHWLSPPSHTLFTGFALLKNTHNSFKCVCGTRLLVALSSAPPTLQLYCLDVHATYKSRISVALEHGLRDWRASSGLRRRLWVSVANSFLIAQHSPIHPRHSCQQQHSPQSHNTNTTIISNSPSSPTTPKDIDSV